MFGKSYEQIMGTFTKTIDDLQKRAMYLTSKKEELKCNIRTLSDKAAECELEYDNCTTTAAKLAELIS